MARNGVRLDGAINWLSNFLAVVGGIALMLMMIQTVLDVIADQFFSRPIPGNLEVISIYHMVLVVFLPLAFVEQRHEHIQVDLLYLLMPRPMQRIVLLLGYLVSAGFFAVLSWRTLGDALRSLAKNEMMMGNVYLIIWPAKFVLPIGFGAICLMVLLHAWRVVTDPAFSPTPPKVEEGHI
jgi:TRAP-type C4-dicarboxylate transport system permease small subunit